MFECSQVLEIDPPDSFLILRFPSESTVHQEDLRFIDLRLRENPVLSCSLNLNGGENLRDPVGIGLDIDFTGDRTEEGRPEYHPSPRIPVDVLLSVHRYSVGSSF